MPAAVHSPAEHSAALQRGAAAPDASAPDATAPGHTGVPTAFISLCGFTALLSAAVRKAQAAAQPA